MVERIPKYQKWFQKLYIKVSANCIMETTEKYNQRKEITIYIWIVKMREKFKFQNSNYPENSCDSHFHWYTTI